ncbi:hypothetical protein ED236_02500 [Pseudomethylobacillus aquaticus]|uniref:EF-hand domain-containing protein n=2 Tax=Pseudomethylobacillus aquaticus TaxID=2676064 RepID=A0A3N0V7I6_9PROT|nr:hypothetical protein ED236_02500 [Pseudomethylobacillus aquaticus]
MMLLFFCLNAIGGAGSIKAGSTNDSSIKNSAEDAPSAASGAVASSSVSNTFPSLSVEDNLRLMDKDRNGMVDVSEVRHYLESLRGKGYQSATLDRLELSSGSRSCGSAFSGSVF